MRFRDMLCAIGTFIAMILMLMAFIISENIGYMIIENNGASKTIQIDGMYVKFEVPVQEDINTDSLIENLGKNINAEDIKIYEVRIRPVIDSLILTFCKFENDVSGIDETLKELKLYGLVYSDGYEKVSSHRDEENNEWELYKMDDDAKTLLYITPGYAICVERENNNPINKEHLDRVQIVNGYPSLKKMKDGYIKLGNIVHKPKKIKDTTELKSVESLGTKIVFEDPMDMEYSGWFYNYSKSLSEDIGESCHAYQLQVNNGSIINVLTDREINNKFELSQFLEEAKIFTYTGEYSVDEVFHEFSTHKDSKGTKWTTYTVGFPNGFNANIVIQVGRDEYGTHLVYIGNRLRMPKFNIEATGMCDDVNKVRIGNEIIN